MLIVLWHVKGLSGKQERRCIRSTEQVLLFLRAFPMERALLFYPFEKERKEEQMKNKFITKLSLLLAVIMMLTFASCSLFEEDAVPEGIWADATYTEDTELGEGPKTVQVELKIEDKSITFTIHTNAKTLGEALTNYGIIEGEDSQFGLYIKKVNGITADYDVDGSYWGFYKNGEYMMSGVDTTEINGGEHFELVYEK